MCRILVHDIKSVDDIKNYQSEKTNWQIEKQEGIICG